MKENIIKNGIEYVKNGDYLIPDLTAPEREYHIGKYGMLHKTYLKQNHRSLYSAMMIKGTLLEYLSEVDLSAKQMFDTIVKDMVSKQNVSEKFKAENQLQWVGIMKNIKHSAEEAVLHDIVYSMDGCYGLY